jgi:hypothetical protein
MTHTQRRTLRHLAVVLFFALGTARAHAGERALILRAGSNGFGLDSATTFSDRLDLRVGGSFFNFSTDWDESGISYQAHLKLRSLSGLVDIHPIPGPFRLTGGVVYNKNRIESTAVPTTGTYELGGVTYPAAQVGTLSGVGRIGTRKWAPYAGLGVGRARGDRRAFFFLDLGVIFQGPPSIELTATGPLATDPVFQASLRAEAAEANADLEDGPYKYYPVLALGVGFRF